MDIQPIRQINFKGYDALPLKKLHIASSWGKIEDELFDVSKREGFEVKTSLYNGSFNQNCSGSDEPFATCSDS